MGGEKIFLDETFEIVKYNNTAPVRGGLVLRRANAHVASVHVMVTDKRIVVDEKMTVLANIAAVSVGDDEQEVGAHNKFSRLVFKIVSAFLIFNLVFGSFVSVMHSEWFLGVILITSAGFYGRWLLSRTHQGFTPDYAVVIESAGTRDNALVSKDRMVVQKIVRAISDALLSR